MSFVTSNMFRFRLQSLRFAASPNRQNLLDSQTSFQLLQTKNGEQKREARNRFKAAHPELFPKPEPTPPTDPNKKKTKSKFKRKKKKVDPKSPGDGTRIKKSLRKHPLRVPGMKPGDSCFICKAKDHIARFCPEKAQWERNKICLLCRSCGHSLKNCPNKNDKTMDKKLCYNCGESGHSLDKCPQPLQEGGTKFATCLICKESGHLSKNCPQNAHGIYPKGGCCKICGGVTHLAKDCTNKGSKDSAAANKATRAFSISDERPRGQVTKFVSGDDLEDDFMADDTYGGKKEKSMAPKAGSTSTSQESNLKLKKKQGPKVVNFVG